MKIQKITAKFRAGRRAVGRMLLIGFLVVSFSGNTLAEADSHPAANDYIEFDLGEPMADPPSIGPDGTLYINFRGEPRRIAAFNRGGERLWEFVADSAGELSLPVIDPSGRIYFGAPWRKVIALNPDGTIHWELSLPQQMVGTPALTGDGLLVFATADRFMNAVKDGKFVWRTQAETTQNSSPSVAADGSIYFLTQGLAKVTPNGTLIPGLQLSCSNFTLAQDGSIYFRNLQPWSLGKYDPDSRQILWNFLERIDPPPLIAPDGRIICLAGSRLFQVAPGGQLEAEYDLQIGARILAPLTLAADGSVFAVAQVNRGEGLEGALYRIAPDFSSHEERFFGPGALSPVVLGPEGSIYLGNMEGKLFILEGNSPLPEQGWPSLRLDAARTANLSGRSAAPELSGQLTASTGTFAGMVRISWVEPSVFAHCDIFRGPSPDFAEATLLAENVKAGLPFDDYNVEPGAVYYYWVQAKNDSGTSPRIGPAGGQPAPETELLWVTHFDVPLNAPSVGPDGTVYVADATYKLHAVDPASGAVKWSFQGVDSSAPASIAPNGWIITMGPGWTLLGLNPEGELQWQVEGEPHRNATFPAIADDGTIYWGTGSSLRALTLEEGHQKWSLELDSYAAGAPAIGLDGIIYFTTRSFLGEQTDQLRAVHPGGIELWDHELEGTAGSPVAGLDGTSYLLIENGHLRAIHSDGSLKWQVPSSLGQGAPASECVLSPNGTLIAPRLQLFDLTGEPAGSVQVPAHPAGAAAAVSSRSLIFASVGERFYGLDGGGALLWEFEPPAPPLSQAPLPRSRGISAPALDVNSQLYFSAWSSLIAMKTAHAPPPEGWSQFRGNAQRTGRLVTASRAPQLKIRRGNHPSQFQIEIQSPNTIPILIEVSEDLKTWRELITIHSPQETPVIEDSFEANQLFFRGLPLTDSTPNPNLLETER